MAVAIAHGLGLPIDATLRAIYQAPSRLVRGLQPAAAEKLARMLAETGLEIEVVPDDPVAEADAGRLMDVAVHVIDADAAQEVPAILAAFCACDEARAIDLLVTPPGLVLGSVSQATLQALQAALAGHGVAVVGSVQQQARFAALPATISHKAADEIRRQLAEQDPLDLTHGQARALWDRYGRTGHVRIVDRAFLRFELWLDGADGEPDLAALEQLSAVPVPYHRDVLAAAPVILEHGLTHGTMMEKVSAYAAAGLVARGEMTTFAAARVQVARLGTVAQVLQAAAQFGADSPAVSPWSSPAMFETRARLLAAALQRAGCKAEVVDA